MCEAKETVAILLVSVLVQIICGDDNSDGPIVVTDVGSIRGVRATNGNYTKFMSVPYAKVNKSNPFGHAIEEPKFENVFDASEANKLCPQMDFFTLSAAGTLDCLILNIYVPDSTKSLPVMVYIFGGKFNAGSPYVFGPKYLMEHDVILIMVNYRLGPYGFTCLHTPEVPGNQGLRDQFLALKWIKKHISAFGGDPERITLFGNSAGSLSVDFHVLSEQEPLYNNVILQCGTAFHLAPLKGADPGALFNLTQTLGLNTTDYSEAIEFLTNINSSKLIQLYTDSGVYFGPCIEKNIKGVYRMISDNSVNLFAAKAKNLKIMFGSNDDDSLHEFKKDSAKDFPKYVNIFKDALKKRFFFDNKTLVEAEEIVRHFYMGDKEFTEDVRFELSDFFSDIEFLYGTERTIKQYLLSGAELYYYYFTYLGRRNFLQLHPAKHWRGAYHADELGYLFDLGRVTEKPTPEDQLIIDRITTMWSNFAKYGNPIPEPTDLLPVKWTPITQGSDYHYLNITTNIHMEKRPFHSRMAFWDLFYQSYGQYEKARLPVTSDGQNDLKQTTNLTNVIIFTSNFYMLLRCLFVG